MTTAAYSFAHFAVDLGCAFAVFSSCTAGADGFLLYNFFAFAMQMPLGLLADVLKKSRLFALLGLAITALLSALNAFGLLGACLLGLGNGLFHIGAGLEVMDRAKRRSTPLGIFVSPGAIGVYLGTLAANREGMHLPVMAVCLLACGLLLMYRRDEPAEENKEVCLPRGKVLLPAAVLFLVVVLRSFGGMGAVLPWKTARLGGICVFAVAAGKALGGIVHDRFGTVLAGGASLAAAAVLFLFDRSPYAGIAAMLLFNMSMPITLSVLGRKMPTMKGFSFGLLTFALFVGFLPAYLGAPGLGCAAMCGLCLLSGALLIFGDKAGGRQ